MGLTKDMALHLIWIETGIIHIPSKVSSIIKLLVTMILPVLLKDNSFGVELTHTPKLSETCGTILVNVAVYYMHYCPGQIQSKCKGILRDVAVIRTRRYASAYTHTHTQYHIVRDNFSGVVLSHTPKLSGANSLYPYVHTPEFCLYTVLLKYE